MMHGATGKCTNSETILHIVDCTSVMLFTDRSGNKSRKLLSNEQKGSKYKEFAGLKSFVNFIHFAQLHREKKSPEGRTC
jgi:hypothetical protein